MKTFIVDNKEFTSLKEAEMHVIGMFKELAMNDVRDYDRWKPFYEAEKKFQELWEAEGHKTQWDADKYDCRYHNEKVSPEWAEYYKRLDAFEESVYSSRPSVDEFVDINDYHKARIEWEKRLYMDAPESPGQHRANND